MGDAATVALILDEFEIQAVANLAELIRIVGSGDCGGNGTRSSCRLKGVASGDPVQPAG